MHNSTWEMLYISKKKYEEAANLFESLAKKTTDKTKLAQTYHNYGNALLQDKKYEEF